jgi:ATP-dependent Clp protease adaptor protein ClpS
VISVGAADSFTHLRSAQPTLGVDQAIDANPREVALYQQPWRVCLHNDNVTPMDYVVGVLQEVFAFGWFKAMRVMLTAHISGLSEVCHLSPDEAQARVASAHARARGDAWPLHFSCEPTT